MNELYDSWKGVTIKHKSEYLKRHTFKQLSVNDRNKFVELFGDKGVCKKCWCMFYSL